MLIQCTLEANDNGGGCFVSYSDEGFLARWEQFVVVYFYFPPVVST